jgi:hypothetical protein
MTSIPESIPSRRFGLWGSVLAYGVVLFVIYGASAFLIETYSGSCMFVLPIYFYALVTVLAVLILRRFGIGAAIYLPIATLGAVMDYYGDWVVSRNLIGPRYALGWTPIFLGIGMAADLAFRIAPRGWHPRWQAVMVGVLFGLAFYLLVLSGLSALYPPTDEVWHIWYFKQGVYFTLPWMLINGGFAGYSAYALSMRV